MRRYKNILKYSPVSINRKSRTYREHSRQEDREMGTRNGEWTRASFYFSERGEARAFAHARKISVASRVTCDKNLARVLGANYLERVRASRARTHGDANDANRRNSAQTMRPRSNSFHWIFANVRETARFAAARRRIRCFWNTMRNAAFLFLFLSLSLFLCLFLDASWNAAANFLVCEGSEVSRALFPD